MPRRRWCLVVSSALALCIACNSPEVDGDDSGAPGDADVAQVDGAAVVDAGSVDAGPVDGRDALVDAGDTCEPLTCADDACGATDDGCGGTLECGGCGDGRVCATGACVSAAIVNDDAQLAAAIAGGMDDVILIAPGTYALSDMAAGVDRSASPLTIEALDPSRKPVFEDATQSLVRTRHVTFRNLSFVNTGALGSGDIWFHDGGGNGEGGDAHHITIEGCDFTSPNPGERENATADPDYAAGLARLFRFSNYATHTYTIRGITASYAYQVGDFRMNGDVLIDDVEVDFWYFDGIRIVGSPDEGYVDGDRVISNVDLTNNLAVYEEIDGTGAPHPDHTQMFNTGSRVNNTNPRVQNLLFYRNRFNAGQFRSNNTQSGLTQTYMVNVGYVENVWATKASPHGISLEGGANGVLIERHTMADVNWGSRPWVRVFRSDGQVLVADSVFGGGFNIGTGGNANLAGYALESHDNEMSADYASLFAGPARENGVDALMTMFTPMAGVSAGALDSSGSWRGGAHRPMRALAPMITGGAGELRVDVIHEPTLESPEQAASGGREYSRYDLRWSVAGAHEWTTVSDVSPSRTITPVTAGTVEVQTRCVNSAGEGLWSASAEVTVR